MLFPSPGDIPDPGMEPTSPALRVDSFTTEPPGKSHLLEGSVYKDLNPGIAGKGWLTHPGQPILTPQGLVVAENQACAGQVQGTEVQS